MVKAGGSLVKLPKIDHSMAIAESAEGMKEREVHAFTIYEDQTFVAVLSWNGAHVALHLYKVGLKPDLTVTRTHVLHTPFTGGGVALSVVDDLIFTHNQSSGTSVFFDVGLSGESDGHIVHHNPISTPVTLGESSGSYPASWVMFVPDIVIDAKKGFMWEVKILLNDITQMKKTGFELPKVVGFLLQREKAKNVLLDVLYDWCSDPVQEELHAIGTAFNLINREYRGYLDSQMKMNLALPLSPFMRESHSCIDFGRQSDDDLDLVNLKSKVILDQADLYSNFFSPMLEAVCNHSNSKEKRKKIKRMVAILLEYSRSLEEHRIPVQHFLNELLINLLVQNSCWYQLHQLLQYLVIADSKPLACLLLSLENVYPPACQLALDMLSRLRNSVEEICEILLSKKRVLSALQFASDRGLLNSESFRSRKFLAAATSGIDMTKDTLDAESRLVFYSTYNFFKQRNLIQRGCEDYTEFYEKLFN